MADDGRVVRTVGLFDPLPEVDLLDRMRRTGGGVEDVNIVGDPCPTGIPPGDAADGGLLVDDAEGGREGSPWLMSHQASTTAAAWPAVMPCATPSRRPARSAAKPPAAGPQPGQF
jgi:hypothetical protein